MVRMRIKELYMNNIYLGMILVITILLVFGQNYVSAYADFTYEDKESQEKDVLLRGYNVFSGKGISVESALSTNSYIIDRNNSEYSEHLRKREMTDNISWYSSSDNLLNVVEDYSEYISQDLFGNIYRIDTELQNNFMNNSAKEDVIISKYELYTVECIRRSYLSDLNVEDIKKYLNDGFKNDLYAVDSLANAEALFMKYGTHLLTGANFGGRMNITSYITTKSADINLDSMMSLKSKIEVALEYAKAGITIYNNSEEYGEIGNNHITSSNYSFTIYGGKIISGTTMESLFKNNGSLMDTHSIPYFDWLESVDNDENLVIVSVPVGARAIPIWELIDDKEENSYNIREFLVECYLKLCNKKNNEFLLNQGQKEVEKIITEIKIDLTKSSIEFIDKKFQEGERIDIKDLSGLAVRVVYSDGTNKLITKLDESEELEIMDPIIGKDGSLFLYAKNYSAYEKINLAIIQYKDENISTIPTEQIENDIDKKQREKENNTSIEPTEKSEQTNIEQAEDGITEKIENDSNNKGMIILVVIIVCLVITILVLLKKLMFLKKKNN